MRMIPHVMMTLYLSKWASRPHRPAPKATLGAVLKDASPPPQQLPINMPLTLEDGWLAVSLRCVGQQPSVTVERLEFASGSQTRGTPRTSAESSGPTCCGYARSPGCRSPRKARCNPGTMTSPSARTFPRTKPSPQSLSNLSSLFCLPARYTKLHESIAGGCPRQVAEDLLARISGTVGPTSQQCRSDRQSIGNISPKLVAAGRHRFVSN